MESSFFECIVYRFVQIIKFSNDTELKRVLEEVLSELDGRTEVTWH
jgi:hypothetical protein